MANRQAWSLCVQTAIGMVAKKKKTSCVLLKSSGTHSSKAFRSYFKYFSGQQCLKIYTFSGN
jgi:hypothetical protein